MGTAVTHAQQPSEARPFPKRHPNPPLGHPQRQIEPACKVDHAHHLRGRACSRDDRPVLEIVGGPRPEVDLHTNEAILVANAAGMTPPLAANAYNIYVNETTGFFHKPVFDPEAIKTVLALRSKHGAHRRR